MSFLVHILLIIPCWFLVILPIRDPFLGEWALNASKPFPLPTLKLRGRNQLILNNLTDYLRIAKNQRIRLLQTDSGKNEEVSLHFLTNVHDNGLRRVHVQIQRQHVWKGQTYVQCSGTDCIFCRFRTESGDALLFGWLLNDKILCSLKITRA